MDAANQNDIFAALSDPHRRAILSLLGQHDELTVGEIAQSMSDIGRTAVSGHVRVLRLSGLITERREANFRWYSVTPRSADEVVGFLSEVYANSMEHLTSALDTSQSDEQIA